MRNRNRSVRQTLGLIVVAFEVIVIMLGALVVGGLKIVPMVPSLIGGVIICIALVVAAAMLGTRGGVIFGWIVQAAIVATGFLQPMMFVVGALFAATWAYAMYQGTRIDNRAAQAAELQ